VASTGTAGPGHRRTPGGPRASGLAWASLILGIVGLLGSIVCVGGLLAIPGVVCGHLALSRARAAAGTRRGRRLALAGLVAGYFAIVASSAMVPALWGTPPEKARRVICSSNLKALGFTFIMYAADYDEHFPEDWAALVRLNYCTATKVYICPSTHTAAATSLEEFCQAGPCDYLYFGKGLARDCGGHPASQTILACDKPGNHRRYLNVLFADGHVKGFTGTGDVEELARREGFFLPGR
jgi:prepilin-type processing-associated H-X9-DG protein